MEFDVFNEYKKWDYRTEELRGCLAGIIDVDLNWLRKLCDVENLTGWIIQLLNNSLIGTMLLWKPIKYEYSDDAQSSKWNSWTIIELCEENDL